MDRAFGIAAALLFLLSSACGGRRPGNLLPDAGFETGSGEEPSGWARAVSSGVQSVRLGVSGEDSHSGAAAFRIGRVWGRGYIHAGLRLREAVPVKPGNDYFLSLWYRTSDDIGYALPVAVRVAFDRSEGELLRMSKLIDASPSWRQVYWVIHDLPEDVTGATVEVGLTIRTPGELFIDDLVFRRAAGRDIDLFERWRRGDILDAAGSTTGLEFDGSGRFRLEEAGGRWWLVDPRGEPTWIMGTMASYPGPTGNGNPALMEWAGEHYENQPAYCRMVYDLLQRWGFNGLAGWTPEEFDDISGDRYRKGEPYLPTFRVLGLSEQGEKGYYLRDRDGDTKGPSHAFPDPYNPQWRRDARKKAETIVARYRDRPWFVGYFIDNEIDYRDGFLYIWADYSAREFVSFLGRRYGTIADLNRAWTSPLGSYDYKNFDDILKDRPAPRDFDDPLYNDFTAFERRLVGEYISFTYDLVKGLDPEHLVISNRLNLGPLPDLRCHIDLWGRYDIVAMNIYPQNLVCGFSPGELALMEALHEGTGRPIIIGEWSVPAIDSGLYDTGPDPLGRPLDWSWPQVLRIQAERGEAYRACMMQLASLPFAVGAGWFKLLDVDSPTRRANRGIIGAGHRPYEELVKSMTATHAGIARVMGLGR